MQLTCFSKAMSIAELMEMSCPQHGTSAWAYTSASWRLNTGDLDTTLSPKSSDYLFS